MNNDFKWRHFQGEIILWAVRWYCKYGISYRELEEMMSERGIDVDHSTIYRWVQHYAPELHKRLKWHFRGTNDSWRVDETYIKIKGEWKYLYRAVDSRGNTIDFYLSHTRNAKAAKRFLAKALHKRKPWDMPRVINTDKAGCYGVAIRELKNEGKMPHDTEHRQVKYLNNIVESDHGKLKRIIKPTLGFKSMKTAYATIKGFEVMRSLKKGQGSIYRIQEGITGEIRLVERCFNIGKCALADAMDMLADALQKEQKQIT
jgi:transposase, IS6 family